MTEKSLMYTDMSERALLKWTLDYTMPWIIEAFEAIPEDLVCVRPRPNINAPGWIFGHIAVKERIHIAGFAQGINDIRKEYKMFLGFQISTEEQLRDVITSKSVLIDYWRDVRRRTHQYLDELTDEDLQRKPQTLNPGVLSATTGASSCPLLRRI